MAGMMAIGRALAGIALFGFALTACGTRPMPQAPATMDLRDEIRKSAGAGAQVDRPGECWATDTTPAVIETVSEQVIASPERRDAGGRVIAPATYRSEIRQRIIRERTSVQFRSPCPAAMTIEFLASLQRALKARGYYDAPITGEMDAATRAAIRRYQEPLGLDSPLLSLAAAQALGLVPTELKDL